MKADGGDMKTVEGGMAGKQSRMWGMLNSVLNISCKHLATQGIQVDSIAAKTGQTVPTQVKIVNKTKVVDQGCGLEPGAQGKNSDKMP